jgi:hypothetical protein
MDPSCVNEYCIYHHHYASPCNKISELKNQFCNIHQCYATDHVAINNFISQDNRRCISVAKYLVEKANNKVNVKDKANCAIDSFDYFCKNKRFLFRHKMLQQVVLDKLQEFAKESYIIENNIDLQKYITELFPNLEDNKNLFTENEIDENDITDGIKCDKDGNIILEL